MPGNMPKCSDLEKEINNLENEIRNIQKELFTNRGISNAGNTETMRHIDSLRVELRVKNSELTQCRP